MSNARSYSVEIDGKALSFKYSLDERELIEGMFPRPDGTPGALGAIVRGHLVESGSIVVQTAILWAGLRHNQGLTREKVRKALDEAIQGDGIRPLLIQAMNALAASGVINRVVDVPEPEEPGKATT